MNEQLKEAVSEAIREALGEAVDCTRAWSAWGEGTMSEDDFSPVADDSERVAEIADAVLAVVAAQPSPGGQDALEQALEQAWKRFNFSRDAGEFMWNAALAARQPVGEPVCEVSRESFSSDGTSDIIKPNLPIGTKLYAAPPAQAVDLGQFREVVSAANARLQSVIGDNMMPWSEREKASKEQAALYPLLALIDKAVGNG